MARNFDVSLKPVQIRAERIRVQDQLQSQGNAPARTERVRARRTRRRYLHGLGLAASVSIAVASATVAVSVFTLHLGFRPVLTGSMRPDYGPGAILVPRQIPTSSVRPGMIVLFVPPGEHAEYAHRITTVSHAAGAPVVTTKGDANTRADPWHARLTSTHVSEVVGSVPGIGRILVAIRGTGQILLAVAGGLVAAWAGVRWFAGPASRSPKRRMTAGGA